MWPIKPLKPLIKPAIALADPVAEAWAQDLQGLAGLGLNLTPDRVITEHAIDLIIFHGDLLNVVEVVTLVIRQPQVGVVALQFLAGVAAEVLVADEQQLLRGPGARSPAAAPSLAPPVVSPPSDRAVSPGWC